MSFQTKGPNCHLGITIGVLVLAFSVTLPVARQAKPEFGGRRLPPGDY